MISGHKTEDIILHKKGSLYSRFGELFFWVVLALLWMAYRDKKKSSGYARV